MFHQISYRQQQGVMSFDLSNKLSTLSYQNLYAFTPPGAKVRAAEMKKSFLIIFKIP